VVDCELNPKTTKNLVGILRIMWNAAKAWGYVSHDPFGSLVLLEWDKPEQPAFSPEDIKRIIDASQPPYDTVYWLVAQTGIRHGEVCALDVGHVDLENCTITVRRTAADGTSTTTRAGSHGCSASQRGSPSVCAPSWRAGEATSLCSLLRGASDFIPKIW